MGSFQLCATALFAVLSAVLVFLISKSLHYEPLNTRQRRIVIVIFIWLALTSALALSGFLADFQSLPPRMLIILLPPILLAVFLAKLRIVGHWLQNLPPNYLVAIQSFRIVMEIVLWMLYLGGVIPVQMTFEGRNWDIVIGLTAPLIGYMCFVKRSWPLRIATWWNIAGLIILANIVIIAILSTPMPFRMFMNEPANTIIANWPFVWLPAFVVPVAYTAHLLSLRQLRQTNV